MYKVIIVDDESWIIESLKRSISWSEYGFEVIGQAADGIEAIGLIESMKPDVVFIDIRMPGMNGLELIRTLKEKDIHTSFIVISGLSEFKYAQTAINSGADGYCLKPFDEFEIINILLKLRKKYDKEFARHIMDSPEILESIEEKHGNEAFWSVLQKYGFNTSPNKILFIASVGKNTLDLPPHIRYVSFKIGARKRVYIVDKTSDPNIIRLLQSMNATSNQENPPNSIGINVMNDESEFISDVIKGAFVAAYQFFITGTSTIYEYGGIDNSNHEIATWFSIFRSIKTWSHVVGSFNDLTSLFLNKNLSIEQAFHVYNLITFDLYWRNEGREDMILSNYEQLVELYTDLNSMMEHMRSLWISNTVIKPDFNETLIHSETLKPIKKFIDGSFNANLSIQVLADRFNINPSYISILFKREVGKTLSEYLSELRLNYAGKLLQLTDMSISEIVEKTGHNDYFYFCKVFKKYTGLTPTQFRMQKNN